MKVFGHTLNLIEANQKIAVLETEAKDATAKIEALEASMQSLKESHEKELADLKAAHQTEKDELKGQVNLLNEQTKLLEEQQESAAQKAVKVLSNVGVDAPVEEPKGTKAAADKTAEELWDEYRAISDAKEKRAFYLEHLKTRI